MASPPTGVVDFQIMHLNVNSLKHKSQFLESYLEDHPVNVLCISEHHLCRRQIDIINIDRMNLASSHCRTKCKRGGVAIFCNQNISFKPIDVSIFTIDVHCELTALFLSAQNIAIVSVYRSPVGNFVIFLNNLERLLHFLCKYYSTIVICGDFNVNLKVSPSDKNYSSIHKKKIALLDLLSSFNMVQTIFDYTRITRKSKTLIDNIFINLKETCIGSNSEVGISDHLAQRLKFNHTMKSNDSTNHVVRKSRIFNNESVSHFKTLLSSGNWSPGEHMSDDCLNTNFLSYFKTCFDDAFPVTTKKFKPSFKTGWLTSGIRKSSKTLRELAFNARADEHSIPIYKRYKTIYRRVIRNAKIMSYESRILKARNPTKEMWNIIKEGNNNNRKALHSINKLIHNGKEFRDPSSIAEILNDHFLNIKSTVISPILPPSPPSYTNSMACYDVTEDEVLHAIQNLKNTYATGYDEIPSVIIKRTADDIVPLFTLLINKSFSAGVFPPILKTTLIKPLHKAGDYSNPNNYRPIALVSVFSKIFEKLMHKNILSFLQYQKCISSYQHGFLPNKSTTTGVFSALELIHNNMNEGLHTLCIFVDLSKAFDSINHDILLTKMSAYGIRGRILDWIKSYISNRPQIVEINHNGEKVRSEPTLSNRGVPQGSIIGPLLFTIYINDLPQHLSDSKVIMYADDCTIILGKKSEEELRASASQVMTNLSEWCSMNRLAINSNKTKFMIFKSKLSNHISPCSGIIFKNETIEEVQESKFLGLIVDSHLNWQNHINTLCKHLSSSSFLFSKLTTYCNKNTLLSCYYSYVYSRIKFNIIAWGTADQYLIDRVLILQKRILRIIFKLKTRDSCKPLFKKHNILPVPCIIILESAMFVYKNKHLFKLNSDFHSYETRNKKNIVIAKHHTHLYEMSPYYSCSKIFNNLPKELNKKSEISFKSSLKSFLIKNCFYSLNSYFNRVSSSP